MIAAGEYSVMETLPAGEPAPCFMEKGVFPQANTALISAGKKEFPAGSDMRGKEMPPEKHRIFRCAEGALELCHETGSTAFLDYLVLSIRKRRRGKHRRFKRCPFGAIWLGVILCVFLIILKYWL